MPLALGIYQSDSVNNLFYITFHILLLASFFSPRSSLEIFHNIFFLPAFNAFN